MLTLVLKKGHLGFYNIMVLFHRYIIVLYSLYVCIWPYSNHIIRVGIFLSNKRERDLPRILYTKCAYNISIEVIIIIIHKVYTKTTGKIHTIFVVQSQDAKYYSMYLYHTSTCVNYYWSQVNQHFSN